MRGEIAETMREIFNSSTLEIAQEMKRRAIEKYQRRASEFGKWLEENVEEGLAGLLISQRAWEKDSDIKRDRVSESRSKKKDKSSGIFSEQEISAPLGNRGDR